MLHLQLALGNGTIVLLPAQEWLDQRFVRTILERAAGQALPSLDDDQWVEFVFGMLDDAEPVA